MRLFVAIDLPEAIKDQVEDVCTGLPSVRWVKREQLHLTLRFIGETEKNQFDALDAAFKTLTFSPFELALEGVGQFPPKREPRVLWVGVRGSDLLNDLACDVEAAVVRLGFPPESKPFSPHITLARLKTPPTPSLLRAFYERHARFKTAAFMVDQFILYSSTLDSRGAIYKKEAIYKASAGA